MSKDFTDDPAHFRKSLKKHITRRAGIRIACLNCTNKKREQTPMFRLPVKQPRKGSLLLLILLGLCIQEASPSIISLDSVWGSDTLTRDTDSGLEWLDVTLTRGLSYNQVIAKLGSGGEFEGFRYALTAELDQLISNFGITSVNTNCDFGVTHCNNADASSSDAVERMIELLGDTHDAYYDSVAYPIDVAPDGRGGVLGFLADTPFNSLAPIGMGEISDREYVYRSSGSPYSDSPDYVNVIRSPYYTTDFYSSVGSFLVRPVPEPESSILFLSFLLGYFFSNRYRQTPQTLPDQE